MPVDSRILEATRGVQRRLVELRADADKFQISGRAIKYGAWSQDLGGFIEQIRAGAFAQSLRVNPDVKLYWSHDAGQPLARVSNGSLKITDSTDALTYTAQLNKNIQAHRDAFEMVKSGLVHEMSFAFQVNDGGQQWDSTTQPAKRTVTSANLYEISLVSEPAYAGVTAAEARTNGGHQRKITKVNPSAVAILRKATARMVSRGLRDIGDHFGDQWDFASQLQYAQSCAEFAHAQLVQARDMWDTDTSDDGFCDPASPDYDPSYEEDCRNALTMAHTHANLACDHITGMALRYGGRLNAKQVKD